MIMNKHSSTVRSKSLYSVNTAYSHFFLGITRQNMLTNLSNPSSTNIWFCQRLFLKYPHCNQTQFSKATQNNEQLLATHPSAIAYSLLNKHGNPDLTRNMSVLGQAVLFSCPFFFELHNEKLLEKKKLNSGIKQ